MSQSAISTNKYSRWRAVSLTSVYVLMGLHITHWLVNGQTLAPLEFNEVLHTIHLGIITAGFLFMALTMVATLIFGRFFCSWGCHILALQDLCAWLLEKFKLRPKPFSSRVFILIPFVILVYLFVWPQFERMLLGLEAPQWRILSAGEGWASFITDDFWRNLPGVGIMLLTFFICGFVIVWFLGSRSFCQNACPYGALFALSDRVAPGKILLKGNCNQCGICTTVCDSNIIVHKEIEKFGKVVSQDCMKDLDCVAACPEKALGYGFSKPSFGLSLKNQKDFKKKYSLSFGEDIAAGFLFFIYLLIYRNLYEVVPFLLAIGIALILAYLTILLVRIFNREHVQFQHVVLKSSKRITKAGKTFLIGITCTLLFTIHSGFIGYHHYVGTQQFLQLKGENRNWVNQNLVPATLNQEKLNQSSASHLETSLNFSPIKPYAVQKRLAALYTNSTRFDKAAPKLKIVLQEEPNDVEALLALGIIEGNNGSLSKARSLLNRAVKLDPENEAIHFNMGLILMKSGSGAEAASFFQNTVALNPGNGKAWMHLAMHQKRAKQMKKARLSYETALKSLPTEAAVHFGLAQVLFALNEKDKAIQHQNQAIQLDNRYAKFSLK